MTMFCGGCRFSPIVCTTKKKVNTRSAAAAGLSASPRSATAPAAMPSGRETLPRGIGRIAVRCDSSRIDVGVVPDVEYTKGISPRGDCDNCNEPEKRTEVAGRDHQPISVVKTVSGTTLGFISETKSVGRAV